jgi:hypothetical protein
LIQTAQDPPPLDSRRKADRRGHGDVVIADRVCRLDLHAAWQLSSDNELQSSI